MSNSTNYNSNSGGPKERNTKSYGRLIAVLNLIIAFIAIGKCLYSMYKGYPHQEIYLIIYGVGLIVLTLLEQLFGEEKLHHHLWWHIAEWSVEVFYLVKTIYDLVTEESGDMLQKLMYIFIWVFYLALRKLLSSLKANRESVETKIQLKEVFMGLAIPILFASLIVYPITRISSKPTSPKNEKDINDNDSTALAKGDLLFTLECNEDSTCIESTVSDSARITVPSVTTPLEQTSELRKVPEVAVSVKNSFCSDARMTRFIGIVNSRDFSFQDALKVLNELKDFEFTKEQKPKLSQLLLKIQDATTTQKEMVRRKKSQPIPYSLEEQKKDDDDIKWSNHIINRINTRIK
jgi:hypothetical protein